MPRLIEAFEAERQGVGTQPSASRGDLMIAPAPKILILAGLKITPLALH
jgi:hypothetical protein